MITCAKIVYANHKNYVLSVSYPRFWVWDERCIWSMVIASMCSLPTISWLSDTSQHTRTKVIEIRKPTIMGRFEVLRFLFGSTPPARTTWSAPLRHSKHLSRLYHEKGCNMCSGCFARKESSWQDQPFVSHATSLGPWKYPVSTHWQYNGWVQASLWGLLDKDCSGGTLGVEERLNTCSIQFLNGPPLACSNVTKEIKRLTSEKAIGIEDKDN